MAQSIALIQKYVDKLDEVYKLASKSAILDGDNTLVQMGANANEIKIPKLSMDGLATYGRNSGYVTGDVTLAWETAQFNYDRGRVFSVDAMDNEETAGIAFGKLASEFLRTKVAPELDAFRFAKYASETGISTVSAAALSTGANVISALRVAVDTMDEDEVDNEGRVLFITPTLLGLVEDLDTTKSREVINRFAQVVTVPQTRFYTKVTLKDGTTSGQEAGGYAKDSSGGGVNINFLIVQKSAPIQYTKHTVSKVIRPEENQTADAWKFPFRSYGIADVYENKRAGIYLHKSTS